MTVRQPIRPASPEERRRILDNLGLDDDRLPKGSTAAERLAAQPVTKESLAMPETQPVTSPTGEPIIPTGTLLKIAAAVVALAAVALAQDFFPNTQVDEKIASAIIALGTVLGIASPGIRKK